MAWRSSGNDNDDMVDNLKRFGVISTPAVEAAFRSVDRLYFVPQNRLDLAHSDQPLKEENIHISAPHIYGTIAEALDLQPGSSQSFLNVGSGTGYLSCIVSQILGSDSCSFGVEIFPDVVEHAKESLKRWRNARKGNRSEPIKESVVESSIEFVSGNGLEIDATKGECQFGFDRIYVGASVHRNNLNKFASLLRPGGVLVAPVEDNLIKVVRISQTDSTVDDTDNTLSISQLPRSSNGRTPNLSEDFSVNVVSGVRFAALLRSPSMKTIIPCKIWKPSIHHNYPKIFKDTIKEIILCSQAPALQPVKVAVQTSNINLASMLPKDLWIKILSYTHRSWFEQPYKVDDGFLRQRLRQEQQVAQKAKLACAEAERRMRIAERERDGYKLLAMRWQLRLRAVLSEASKSQGNNSASRAESSRDEDQLLMMDDLTQAAVSLFHNDSFFLRMSNINARRRFRHDSQESSDDDVDENVEAYENDEADETNMEVESDDEDDNHNNNDMEGTSSEEDDSEDFTVAASPYDASDTSSFYRRVSESLENQTFFP